MNIEAVLAFFFLLDFVLFASIACVAMDLIHSAQIDNHNLNAKRYRTAEFWYFSFGQQKDENKNDFYSPLFLPHTNKHSEIDHTDKLAFELSKKN